MVAIKIVAMVVLVLLVHLELAPRLLLAWLSVLLSTNLCVTFRVRPTACTMTPRPLAYQLARQHDNLLVFPSLSLIRMLAARFMTSVV